jgi:hypothetical protein
LYLPLSYTFIYHSQIVYNVCYWILPRCLVTYSTVRIEISYTCLVMMIIKLANYVGFQSYTNTQFSHHLAINCMVITLNVFCCDREFYQEIYLKRFRNMYLEFAKLKFPSKALVFLKCWLCEAVNSHKNCISASTLVCITDNVRSPVNILLSISLCHCQGYGVVGYS